MKRAHGKEVAALKDSHTSAMAAVMKSAEASQLRAIDDLKAKHKEEMERIEQEYANEMAAGAAGPAEHGQQGQQTKRSSWQLQWLRKHEAGGTASTD